MKKALIAIVAFASFLSFSFPVYAADVQGIEIIRYGIYKTEKVRQEDAPNSATGRKYVTKNVFIQNTDKIEAALDTSFGFEYVIRGDEGAIVDIKIRYLHPEITNPKTGKVFTSQEIMNNNLAVGKTYLVGYNFGEPWEIAPGAWTIQLFYGDKMLGEKTFQISKL